MIGDRWTLLIVRLRLLEDEGIAARDASGRCWQLTDKGRDLAPVLASLAAWGIHHYGEPSSAQAVHAGCGGRVLTRSSCTRCGAAVSPAELDLRAVEGVAGPGGEPVAPGAEVMER